MMENNSFTTKEATPLQKITEGADSKEQPGSANSAG